MNWARVESLKNGRGPWKNFNDEYPGSPTFEAAGTLLAQAIEPSPWDIRVEGAHWTRVRGNEALVELMVEMAANSDGRYIVRFQERLEGIIYQDEQQAVTTKFQDVPVIYPDGWHL